MLSEVERRGGLGDLYITSYVVIRTYCEIFMIIAGTDRTANEEISDGCLDERLINIQNSLILKDELFDDTNMSLQTV